MGAIVAVGDVHTNMIRRLLATALVSLLCGRLLASQSEKSQSEKSQSRHTITFIFDYDFSINPACSAEAKKDCVQKFNFYDISLGIPKKIPLGSLAVPPGATGLMKGISFTTERRLFKSGKHRVAVAAQLENGLESDLDRCATIVKMR